MNSYCNLYLYLYIHWREISGWSFLFLLLNILTFHISTSNSHRFQILSASVQSFVWGVEIETIAVQVIAYFSLCNCCSCCFQIVLQLFSSGPRLLSYFNYYWFEGVLCNRAWRAYPGMISCSSMNFPPLYSSTDRDVSGLCYVAFSIRVLYNNNVIPENFRKLVHHDCYWLCDISRVFYNVARVICFYWHWV